MKSDRNHRVGAPDVLKLGERPMPEPKAAEVLIKVAASGVNRPDVFQRRGAYAPPPGASDLPDWKWLVRACAATSIRSTIRSV